MATRAPVFGADDRVDPPVDSLPAELQGKSATEVAAYYERKLREARATQPSATPQPRQPNNSDFWTDPAKAVQTAIDAAKVTAPGTMTKDDFYKMAEPFRDNMVQMAEQLVRQKYSDWDALKPDIDKVMATVEPWSRTQQHMWTTTYFYVKGQKASEGNVQPPTAPRVTVQGPEAGSPAPGAPPAPAFAPLSAEEKFVADHMGISSEQYRTAQKNMKENKFPLTMNNVGR